MNYFLFLYDSPDWTQCTDASSGHPYYWNIITKEVTWEMPIEYQQFLDQAVLLDSHSFEKWTLCYTDDNAPYYFNGITREISWEKPADFVDSSNNQTVATVNMGQNNPKNLNASENVS